VDFVYPPRCKPLPSPSVHHYGATEGDVCVLAQSRTVTSMFSRREFHTQSLDTPPVDRAWLDALLRNFILEARHAAPAAARTDLKNPATAVRVNRGEGPTIFALADLVHNVLLHDELAPSLVELATMSLRDAEADIWLAEALAPRWSLEGLHLWVGEVDLRPLPDRLKLARVADQEATRRHQAAQENWARLLRDHDANQ